MRRLIPLILLLLIVSLKIFAQNNIPPSNLKLKVLPPDNKSVALKRISDFFILDAILPPIIDRNNIKKQLYGDFEKDVEAFLKKNRVNIKEISNLVKNKIKDKKITLKKLKEAINKELNLK